MESKTRLVDGLIISILVFLGCGLGFLIGNLFVGEYNPPWEHYQLRPAPKGIVEITHIEINSTLFDPAGDVVYVADNNGKVFSNTTFQDEWSAIAPVPTWANNHFSKCATEWLGEHDHSHMGDNPPVEKKVIDSAGVRFERPVSTIVRCYLLLDDGNLEVWVHSGNAMDLIAGEFLKIVYNVLGVILGIIIGVIIVRFGKRAESLTT